MKAAVRERYGPPGDVVHLAEIDQPTPVDDQILIRVKAASVNRADLDGIEPRPQFVRLFLGLRAPRNHRLGLDVAGVVQAVGPTTTRFRVGDHVFGDLYPHGQGSFAEYVCVRERAVEPMGELSFEDAATLPHSAILALQGLRRRDGRTIGPGAKVLIDGASGNVGPFAVQIAKSRGAEVTGTCSSGKVEFVRSLGADHVLDYKQVDYTKTGERYDWIVDTDSHHSIRSVRRALNPNGVYVTLGGTAMPLLGALVAGPLRSLFSDKSSGLLLWWKPFHPADVETLKGLVVSGAIRPAIDRRFTLDQIVDAMRWVDEGQSKGKVIVTP